MNNILNPLIEQLDTYFGKKAPQLPAGLKKAIVNFLPYLIIISLIFSVLGMLSMVAVSYNQSLFLNLVIFILQILALSGLFKRTAKSWTLLFYALLVSLLNSLIVFNILDLIVSALIGFYILFQIRPLYTGMAITVVNSTPTPPPSSN